MKKINLIILLFIFNYSTIIGQTRCNYNPKDSLIFWLTELMPTLTISVENLENKINNEIQLKDNNLNEVQIFYVTLIINCKGEGFNYKVQKYENELFNQKFVECIKNIAEWNPAYQGGSPVDIGYSMKFEVLNNKIKYIINKPLTEKERKKLKRTKKLKN